MLKLKVVLSEDFDEAKQEFVTQSIDIELEHSLASLSKWETIWEIPLLSSNDKTEEQNFSYLECMCLTPNVAPEVFKKLNQEQQDQIVFSVKQDNKPKRMSARSRQADIARINAQRRAELGTKG
jgi:hypothetical protein